MSTLAAVVSRVLGVRVILIFRFGAAEGLKKGEEQISSTVEQEAELKVLRASVVPLERFEELQAKERAQSAKLTSVQTQLEATEQERFRLQVSSESAERAAKTAENARAALQVARQ